jgi:phosphoserine phosphatase RsbU/P
LKVCFTAQAKQATDPAKVLAGLNSMLRGSLGGQYVTAACAAIDFAAHTLTYAGAGHPPALLLRKKKGDVIQLAENGLFIGPFPHATYSSMIIPIEAGDKLLLYTDGIIEASGPDGEEFGIKNLESLLLDTRDLEAGQFVEELFLRISNPMQQDDLTVVLTQMKLTPGILRWD